MAMSTKNSVSLHMLANKAGAMIIATTSVDELMTRQAQIPGSTPYLNVDPLVVAQFIDGRAPHKLMADDQAWGLVGPAIKVFHDHVSVYESDEQLPRHKVTPPDTPTTIALNRLELFDRYPHIADLPTVVELSEIVMAHRYDREPNKALFRPESVGRHWGEIMHVGEKHLKELRQQYTHALRGTGGFSGESNETVDHLRLSIAELDYALEIGDDDTPDFAPTM